MDQVNKNPLHLSNYRAEIDSLRAFAVLSVVIYHAFPSWLKGGFIGVDIFFVISGFLITSHIFESLDKELFKFSDFFSRRIRRIFPALILVMAISLVFGWFALLPDEYSQLGKHVAGGAAFIQNFILVGESGYFDNVAETKPMLHLWSLAVEEQFYIVWPFLLWLAWKRKFNLLTITIFVALVSFFLNLKFVKSHPTETFFWPIGRFWELLSGSVLAWLFLYKKECLSQIKLKVDSYLIRVLYTKDVLADGKTTANIMLVLGGILLIIGVTTINKTMPFPSAWAMIPIIGTMLIISSGSKTWLARIFLTNPIIIWFGLISYPLYLWHWPILSFLRIIDGQTPHRDARIIAVILAIVLAWITYHFIEKPIRFGVLRKRVGALFLAITLFVVGCIGYYISTTGLTYSHGYDDLLFKRKGFENAYGSSLKWYKGKEDWLFLGDDYNDTVAKLKLSITPSAETIDKTVKPFEDLARVGAESNTKIALIIGPNKASIYGEYLPDRLIPSKERYISFFEKRFNTIPNLVVHDPINDLLSKKSSEGLLYWRTNTHWNPKGCYIAFKGFADLLGVPSPSVRFEPGPVHRGDLINISKLYDFPLTLGDGWVMQWNEQVSWSSTPIPNQPESPFGASEVITNHFPLSDKTVWVIGDSFTYGLRPYLNATFKEVRYIGHWNSHLATLSSDLQKADKKPDLVLVVRVERSF